MARVSPREALERDRLSDTSGSELKRLWIADRVLRVAECQDTVERINDLISEHRDVEEAQPPSESDCPYDPETQPSSFREWCRVYIDEWEPPKKKPLPALLLRVKLDALRLAAEELGQLPAPQKDDSDPAQFVVSGVSDDDLRGSLT